MGEKKEMKVRFSTVVYLFIILVLVVVLGVVYYLGFVKDLDFVGDTEGKQNVNETTNSNISDVNEATVNSFEIYQENYKNGYKNNIRGENRIYISPDSNFELPGVESIYIDSNNDAYFIFVKDGKLYKRYGAKYKVETNVANIYLCPVGTGGYAEAIFLKLDGTASSVSGYKLEENPVVECNIIEGVKNAVNVITYVFVEYADDGQLGASGPATFFVDVNGNTIDY